LRGRRCRGAEENHPAEAYSGRKHVQRTFAPRASKKLRPSPSLTRAPGPWDARVGAISPTEPEWPREFLQAQWQVEVRSFGRSVTVSGRRTLQAARTGGAAFTGGGGMLDCACGRCACRCVELRALCNDSPQTPPGPEGSNGSGIASCAAEYPKFLSSPRRRSSQSP